MNVSDIIRSILELAAVVFVIWALFNEERFAALEKKLFARIRRSRFKVIKGGGRSSCPKAEYGMRKSV